MIHSLKEVDSLIEGKIAFLLHMRLIQPLPDVNQTERVLPLGTHILGMDTQESNSRCEKTTIKLWMGTFQILMSMTVSLERNHKAWTDILLMRTQ